MRTQSTIIGIGDAMLAETEGRSEPTGLALDIALNSLRLGHVGVAISRLGQDMVANELLTKLVAAGLDVSHLQSDPDLPTGRLVVREVAGTLRRTSQHRAAFDNLQWDFDLVDVAQRADAVVFGMLAQRGGQSQSIIARFICECGTALRVCDLTNRDDDEPLDRRIVFARLERSDIVVIDDSAWRQLKLAGSPSVRTDVIAALLRPFNVAMVLHVEAREVASVHGTDVSNQSTWVYSRQTHAAVITGLLHGLLSQSDAQRCLRLAGLAAEYAMASPDEKLPDDWDKQG